MVLAFSTGTEGPLQDMYELESTDIMGLIKDHLLRVCSSPQFINWEWASAPRVDLASF
jgi:hypothetical protein